MNKINNIAGETVQADIITELYNEYYSKIYKYTLFRVVDPDTTDDLVSEVFEKVLAKYYTFNPSQAKFSTWLFTIANNTIINFHNKKNYRSSINIEKMECKYRLEDSIIERESKERLISAISSLDERQRNIIALKFVACQTNREIAKMLNLTESNVGTILYRSLKRLREILKEQEAVY